MYIPHSFQHNNPADIFEILTTHPFALLLSYDIERGVEQTRLPFEVERIESGFILSSHIAKANLQSLGLVDGVKVTILFSGASAYISSAWYGKEPNVPTWNYISISLKGSIRVISNDDELSKKMSGFIDYFEQGENPPLTWEGLNTSYVDELMPHILFFEVRVEEIESCFKLNQNKSKEEIKRVIRHLERKGDSEALEISKWMKRVNGIE